MGQPEDKSIGFSKFKWTAILLLNIILIMQFDVPDLPYALGHVMAALIFGLVFSPVVYLICKLIKRATWQWYNWVNTIAIIALALDIVRWIVVPMANDIVAKDDISKAQNKFNQAQNMPGQPPVSNISDTSVVRSEAIEKLRTLSDGNPYRWLGDKECFVLLSIDNDNPKLQLTSQQSYIQRFKELTQADRLLAILYYTPDISEEYLSDFLTQDNYNRIKRLCHDRF